MGHNFMYSWSQDTQHVKSDLFGTEKVLKKHLGQECRPALSFAIVEGANALNFKPGRDSSISRIERIFSLSGLKYRQFFASSSFGARYILVDLLVRGKRKNQVVASLHDWEHIWFPRSPFFLYLFNTVPLHSLILFYAVRCFFNAKSKSYHVEYVLSRC